MQSNPQATVHEENQSNTLWTVQ